MKRDIRRVGVLAQFFLPLQAKIIPVVTLKDFWPL
jgi:hypothetical protein